MENCNCDRCYEDSYGTIRVYSKRNWPSEVNEDLRINKNIHIKEDFLAGVGQVGHMVKNRDVICKLKSTRDEIEEGVSMRKALGKFRELEETQWKNCQYGYNRVRWDVAKDDTGDISSARSGRTL